MRFLSLRHQLPRYLRVSIVIVFASWSVLAQSSVATFSGRVTDQNTGQGIASVAVVAQGNQTGTRVAVTDAQGNYTLSLGANTNIRVRAYKTTYIFNPLLAGYASIGGFLTGGHSLDFSGAKIPILIIAPAPILLTEDESLEVLALDSVLQTRRPFVAVNNNYYLSDKRTRLKLFLVDLDLYNGELLTTITVQAQDSLQRTYDFTVVDLRKSLGFPWLTELTVIAPGDLPPASELSLTVSARGQISNAARLHTE